MGQLTFLKLGGSLITDKNQPYTSRLDILESLVAQIAAARREDPDMPMVLGHGSGSFGHATASHYQTHRGVTGQEAWFGFAEVWFQAVALNHLVMKSLHRAGVSALALAPVASVVARDGQVKAWNLTQVRSALECGLLPVVYGDVVFDEERGGTILSTEDLFAHLAHALHPRRILLAGIEPGVWADFPARTRLLDEITPENFDSIAGGLGASASTDVTGGMEAKVIQMLGLVEQIPGLEVLIFSGQKAENMQRALKGEAPGTLIHR